MVEHKICINPDIEGRGAVLKNQYFLCMNLENLLDFAWEFKLNWYWNLCYQMATSLNSILEKRYCMIGKKEDLNPTNHQYE